MRKISFWWALLITSVALVQGAEQITISEFMAANGSGLKDENNFFPDWIEIRNSGPNAVNLDGWFLTDSPGNLTKWRLPATNINAGGFLIVFADGKDKKIPGTPLHANFSLSSSGEYLALTKPDGVTKATEFSPAFPPQTVDVSFGFGLLSTTNTFVSTNAALKVRVPVDNDDGTNWLYLAYNDGSWTAGTNGVGYGATNAAGAPFVRTDLGTAMSNVNASVQIRVPFTVSDPAGFSGLTLRMRYDDGFIAYLNGTEIFRANSPAVLDYNSAATNAHAPTVVDQFVFGPGLLQSGANILAIQGLNVASNDADFLILAELTATSSSGESATPVYFTVPTPGAANGSGVANPGPAILNPGHFPNVPLDAQDLVITTRVVQTFYPISNVVMRYQVMFGSVIEVPMYDDGQHGDGGTNDGVFAATIPENASTNGQMIRWYFRATDTQGNVSRWPIFANPIESAEFLGTIVNPTNVISKIPIVHLFAPPAILQPGPTTAQTGADSQAGSQISLFFDGEFYDNVHMELRGNSTAGFNKKSHRIDFNRDHKFRHAEGFPRIRKTSFTADWPDPTYMRQELTFWLADQFGAPSPFYYPMRLQLNGQFYQLANHNDVHGEEYLSRIGYDPNGALYNAAGQVTFGKASTGGFDKKTRTWDTDADYLELAQRVAETNTVNGRLTNIFEYFDVPEVLNYLAVGRWVHENDDVWANMSLYKDNDGDARWRVFPFDMNLSWGAIFAEGTADLFTGVQATNDTHKSHPLYGSSQTLALSGPGGAFNRVYDSFFQVPQAREMFLRRLRTLLDTYIKPIGTPTNSTEIEQRVLAARDLIAEEANRDRAWWGWPGVGGQNNFAQGINITNGVNDMLEQFFRARRQHFYGKHSVTNTALAIGITKTSNAGIPLAQPSNTVIRISGFDANPGTGNQGHEFIQLTNPNNYAVDISGWKLDGGVNFTFSPGTVVPSASVLYVSPDMKLWRSRTTTPKVGQGIYIVGNYKGSLDARGEIVSLSDDTGRLVHTNGFVPNPGLAQQYLRITELMYHPGPTNLGSAYSQEEFEYIELKNIGPVNLNLVGVHFTNGVDFAFATNSAVTNLAPGQVVLLVKNPAAYVSRHGVGATIAGIFTGTLENNGERLKLDDAVGEQILDFTYNNVWHPITDGLGFSLVVANENQHYTLWDQKSGWKASGSLNGSPGVNEPVPPVFVPVLVNEVLANSDLPDVDAIELWNNTTNVADLSDWWITDDFFTPKKFRVPSGTMLAAGGYLVFTEADFNPGGLGFSFNAKGDEAYLFSGDAAGNLTGYYHGFGFGASEPGVTLGFYLPSDGDQQFVAQVANTLGFANSLPKVGPLIISEIMYHPPDIQTAGGALDDSLNEFIEIHNITGEDVLLFDPLFPTNRWKLTDAVEFSFDTNTVPAGGYLVVVSFNPATNATALAAFRSRYGLTASVPIVGPWSGQLDNSQEAVKLRRPDRSDTNEVAHPLVEEVHYHDSAPWSLLADGYGLSLHRIVPGDFGNDPTNYVAATPSPGSSLGVGAPPVITQQPAGATVFVAGSVPNSTVYLIGLTNLSVGVSGTNLSYQWSFNGTLIPGATNTTLLLTNIQFNQAGAYGFFAYNAAGSVLSSNATLTVVSPVSIGLQPTNQFVQPGTNVTLVVAGTGTGTLRYQWRFEGVNIPNATNNTYSFTGANLTNHHGNFSVVVQDDISLTVSSNAFIYVMVKPVIVTQPQSVSVPFGGSATFSVIATGAPSLWYRWVRQGAAVATSSVPSITFSNIIANGTVRVVVTNSASPSGVNSSTVNYTVLPDADGDGLPDSWETSYFGSSTGGVAGADADGDGVSNLAEYQAGTNPTNAASFLRVVINEWMANNAGAVLDPADGQPNDWFELHNTGPATVNLGGFFLTDNLGNPTRYLIPPGLSIAPGGFQVFWADNQPGQGANHVNFTLSNGGGSIGLYTTNLLQLDAVNFSAAQPNASEGRFPDGSATIAALAPATPGASNQMNVVMNPDADGDGLPDAWEITYFGSTNALPNIDSDGDGMTNQEEYLAGTNPTDPSSVLRLVLNATNATTLTFIGQTNVSYTVQWRTNLTSSVWSNLTSIIASPQVRTIEVNTVVAPPAPPERYLRVVTPAQP